MVMDVDEPQSLIIVMSHEEDFGPAVSIIRLETPPPPPPPPQVYEDASPPPPPLPTVQVFQTGISANLPFFPGFPKWSVYWGFSIPPATSPEDFYMLPDWTGSRNKPKNVGSLPGIIFNLTTKQCKLIKPPRAPKGVGYAVTMGHHIYLMAEPNFSRVPDPCFERYDTLSKSWEELESLPPKSIYGPPHPLSCEGYILGSAVLDDTILFNMLSNDMRAYNVSTNKWYTVEVLNELCHNIVREAVVLNNIIYAVTITCQSLVTLTLLTSKQNDGDLVFTCDLLKEYEVPGMGEMVHEFYGDEHLKMHLVHLGKDNFCVVSWPFEPHHAFGAQAILLTYIEVSEKKSIVTNICVHEFEVPYGDSLDIIRCFSMPNCKSNALKEATRLTNPESETEVVTLPPELPQFLEKYTYQTNAIAKQDFEQGGSVHADTIKSSASVVSAKSNVPSKASTISDAVTGHKSRIYAIPSSATKASTLGDVVAYGRSNTDEEGNSICVRNLPLDFSLIQLYKKLKKFGPIKSVTIPDFSHVRECWVADVEFESSTSKQNAIKATSPLRIGGLTVVIEEKKGTGLARGDSNRASGGSSYGSNTFKKHGEDSGSKTTSGGDPMQERNLRRRHLSELGVVL